MEVDKYQSFNHCLKNKRNIGCLIRINLCNALPELFGTKVGYALLDQT